MVTKIQNCVLPPWPKLRPVKLPTEGTRINLDMYNALAIRANTMMLKAWGAEVERRCGE